MAVVRQPADVSCMHEQQKERVSAKLRKLAAGLQAGLPGLALSVVARAGGAHAIHCNLSLAYCPQLMTMYMQHPFASSAA